MNDTLGEEIAKELAKYFYRQSTMKEHGFVDHIDDYFTKRILFYFTLFYLFSFN